MTLIQSGKRIARIGRRQIAKVQKNLRYLAEFRRFAVASKALGSDMPVRWRDRWVMLNDRTTTTSFLPHYLYFPAWAARVVREISPEKHVDISSYLPFCAILSAFVPSEFYDYRPANIKLSSLLMGRCDLTALHFASDSIQSLSCMHVVEHIGLGRYGDPLDPMGDQKAIRELTRVLAPGGSLLFVVPMGRPRVQFNAHRIYSYRQIVDRFPTFQIRQFVLIPDNEAEAGMIEAAPEHVCNSQNHGCGCFWFVKPLVKT